MNKIFALMFLVLVSVGCNKGSGGSSDGSGEVTITPPVTGETGGQTSGSATTGSSTGSTTSGSTAGGSSTGGSTTGGSSTGGSTTGSTTGGSSTGGTSTGGSGTGLPNAAYTFDTNLIFVNTNADQQEKFDQAIEMIKKVVATEEFRTKILNHTYNGKKTFVDNGGFTNAQIYQKILDAAETLKPVKNNTMDMEVELYYASTTTVGYTYANIRKIYVNTKYFNTNSVGSVAANLFHEWLHKIGFTHSVSYSTSRDYSVPYAVGRIVSSIGSKL